MSEVDDAPQGAGSLQGRGPWWSAAAVVVLVVLAGLVAVLIWGPGGTAQPAPAPQPQDAQGEPGALAPPDPDQAEPAPAPSQDAAVCELPDEDQAWPTTAPRDVQWSLVNTVALPWSPTAGPVERDEALWRCFARTPTGALMAAAVFSVTPDTPQGAQVLEQQTVPGPNQQAQLASLQAQPPPPKQPGETATIAGFAIQEYSRDSAVVQIAAAYGGRYLVVTVPLVWDGDWKLYLDGPYGARPGAPLQSLTGYSLWSAA